MNGFLLIFLLLLSLLLKALLIATFEARRAKDLLPLGIFVDLAFDQRLAFLTLQTVVMVLSVLILLRDVT